MSVTLGTIGGDDVVASIGDGSDDDEITLYGADGFERGPFPAMAWMARNGAYIDQTLAYTPPPPTIAATVLGQRVSTALDRARSMLASVRTRPAARIADGGWDEEAHPRASDGKFGEGDGTSRDLGQAPTTPKEERAIGKLDEGQLKACAERGVSPVAFVRAQADLKDVKAAMRAEAKELQYQTYGMLNLAGIFKGDKSKGTGTSKSTKDGRVGRSDTGGTFPRPDPDPSKRGGEWDWYADLGKAEKGWLGQFMQPAGLSREQRGGIDTMLDAAKSQSSIFEPMGENEFGEWALSTIGDYLNYGLIAQGKAPITDVVMPKMADAGMDARDIAGGKMTNDEQAFALLKSYEAVEHRYTVEPAYNALGPATRAGEYGPAPYQMSYLAWHDEVMSLNDKATDGSISKDESYRQTELIPPKLDDPTMTLEDLYASIIETARIAEMEVPDHAKIPWGP